MNRISIRQALVGLTAASLLVGLLSAGLALDRRIADELERRAVEDLAMAPKVLADRLATESDALMMRAKDLAGMPEVASAVSDRARDEALAMADQVDLPSGEEPLLIGPDGDAWAEWPPSPPVIEATRRGEMPVAFESDTSGLRRVALAPVKDGDAWRGAAGVTHPFDERMAGVLSGLTRTEVLLLGADNEPVASTADSLVTPVVSDSVAAWHARNGFDGEVRRVTGPEGIDVWAVVAPLDDAGCVVFLRDVSTELALLPGLRRSAAIAGLLALGLTLALLVFFAGRLARPVQELSVASRRLAGGEFEAPVSGSRIREIDDVADAFRDMRAALAEKIEQLTGANEELAERQERLQALQAEVLQRDRLAASGRLITELAHEIRNPVAGVRNCLELIHRRLEPGQDELRRFAAMGIDELLRMHRLAERMLDANRPLDPDADRCDPIEIARLVAELAGAGPGPDVGVDASGGAVPDVAMGPDTMKQVLLNLVENAREATTRGAPSDGADTDPDDWAPVEIRIAPASHDGVAIDVLDRGPGLDEAIRDRVFDPFFTTKDAVHGVGLGLFVAEGLARRHGGRLIGLDRDGGGAHFRLEVPLADRNGQVTVPEVAS